MGIVIAVIVAVAVIASVAIVASRRRGSGAGHSSPPIDASHRTGATVAEFHVTGQTASVHFEVPLPDGDVDAVLADLLGREAIEVVREKRHSLPIDDVHEVVAYGRRGEDWAKVTTVRLDLPGELPAPIRPEPLPHAARTAFDVFDRISGAPAATPGTTTGSKKDALDAIGPNLAFTREIESGLRAQGLDPQVISACDLVLGVMRLSGYALDERSADTLDAIKSGQRVFIRTVCGAETDHPELEEHEVDRFVVDFVSSGADRGLCITDRFSPFEIYEREKREPRMRFITRERLQDFIDALTVG